MHVRGDKTKKKTKRWAEVASMLGKRWRLWFNINPALGECVAFGAFLLKIMEIRNLLGPHGS